MFLLAFDGGGQVEAVIVGIAAVVSPVINCVCHSVDSVFSTRVSDWLSGIINPRRRNVEAFVKGVIEHDAYIVRFIVR